MRGFRAGLTSALAFILAACSSAPEDLETPDAATAFSSAVEQLQSEASLMGLAALVMVDGEVVEEAAAGLRQHKQDAALEPTDLYHIGSIGKSMSASAIARLVDRGVLDWGDTVGERLPDFAATIDPAWHDVTLEQLLSHRAGLPRFGIKQIFIGDTSELPLPEQRISVMTALLAEPPEADAAPIGTDFAYRNSGYVLAAMIAEATTGQAWEDILMAEVAEPLGLTSLGFGAPTGAPDGTGVAWGHRRMSFITLPINPATGGDNPRFMSPAGTMHISLRDLARYGHAHLSRDPAFLSADSYAKMQTANLSEYGLGWVVNEHRDWAGGPAIWHNGSNTYWYAILALAPEKNMVTMLASNDGDRNRAEAAMRPLMEYIGARHP